MREVRATLVCAALLLTYMLAVLLSGRVDVAQFAGLFAIYAGGTIAIWVMLGIICISVQTVIQARRSGSEPFLKAAAMGALTARWQRDRGASLLWPPLLFAALMATYNSFKQMILPVVGFRFDHAFGEADRALLLGFDGWEVTHALFASPAATIAIDGLYHSWFLPVALGVIICAWLPASTYRLRTQYLLSYMGVWVGLGTIIAFLVPAAGPCFVAALGGPAEQYQPLMNRLAEAQAAKGTALLALHNQGMLLRTFSGETLVLGGGISAMPSVHNALAVLFALAGRQVSRLLGHVLWIYAIAIFIGSVHLGWHYAVDGLVAAAMTVWLWRACGRLADRLERPLVRRSIEPALA